MLPFPSLSMASSGKSRLTPRQPQPWRGSNLARKLPRGPTPKYYGHRRVGGASSSHGTPPRRHREEERGQFLVKAFGIDIDGVP